MIVPSPTPPPSVPPRCVIRLQSMLLSAMQACSRPVVNPASASICSEHLAWMGTEAIALHAACHLGLPPQAARHLCQHLRHHLQGVAAILRNALTPACPLVSSDNVAVQPTSPAPRASSLAPRVATPCCNAQVRQLLTSRYASRPLTCHPAERCVPCSAPLLSPVLLSPQVSVAPQVSSPQPASGLEMS